MYGVEKKDRAAKETISQAFTVLNFYLDLYAVFAPQIDEIQSFVF